MARGGFTQETLGDSTLMDVLKLLTERKISLNFNMENTYLLERFGYKKTQNLSEG